MKLLGAEEEDLAEGEGEMMGDLREGERRRIATEEMLLIRKSNKQLQVILKLHSERYLAFHV